MNVRDREMGIGTWQAQDGVEARTWSPRLWILADGSTLQQHSDAPIAPACSRDSQEQVHDDDSRGAVRMIELPHSPHIEPVMDNVGGDGLAGLLDVLAEIGLDAAVEHDSQTGGLRVIAS